MPERTDVSPPERLRAAPAERFAGLSHEVDLRAALESLRAEPHPAPHGRRQITVFHRSPVTTALFSFDAGGVLANHRTRGLVTIHVLEGQFLVNADGRAYDLRAGQMLVLNPDVPHDLRATVTSAMLLTVHLTA